MSYGTKMNRYWKRPKPRVYECNVRDAERFYQDSYKQYLQEKEDAARRTARARSIDTGVDAEFYNHLRADRIPATKKESLSRSTADRSELPPLPPQLTDAVKSRLADVTTTETSFTARSEGLPSYDAAKENLSLDERLDRLKKLREELGLPSESKTGVGSSASERLSALRSESASRTTAGLGDTADSSSSYKFDISSRARAGSASRAGEDTSSSYSYKTERSSRMNGTGGLGDDYKFKSERTSSFKSERSNSDYKLPSKSLDFELPKTERKPLNLSPKLERKKDYSFSSADKGESKYSSLSSSENKYSSLSSSAGGAASSSSSTGRSARKVAATTELDVEDDIDVSDMMKKMPTSQEILEKISKMDLDD